MNDLYDRLINLLGKPRSVNGGLFALIVDYLDEKPVVDCNHDRLWTYSFLKSGFELNFDAKTGLFWRLSLYIATPSVATGYYSAYSGNLPYEICLTDSEEVVEAKFPGGTQSIKDYRSDIDLRPLELMFYFQTGDLESPGVGTRKCSMVTATFLGPGLEGISTPTQSR